MNRIFRGESVKKLQTRQSAIVYESDEDEGAFEYYAEIQSVIDVLTTESASDDDIVKAAEWVGLESDLVYFNK